jgi:L-lactate dehydrogenase complex protein LldF
MKPTSHDFKANAARALTDEQLQRALGNIGEGFVNKRAAARDALPEFDALRDRAKAIKDHTIAHLDLYLEEYERKVIEAGGQVHWASTAKDANEIITWICREAGALSVTKGKSMVAEETGLNDALEAAGLEVVETDLGEYIIQNRHEPPSHIIAPAVHLNKDQVIADFRAKHTHLPRDRDITEPSALVGEARTILREKFLRADIGITGANFLVAETGSSVIVTNEGNGDLTQLLPRVHIVIASIEKCVPTLEDLSTLLRVLARSATGQDMTAYNTLSTGPRRRGDPDGPEEFHVVLVDNGRSAMLGTVFQDMLRCIRCGACLNHCPIYNAVGGHAYGWVYPGPMGAVLTPSLIGVHEAGHLPNASTFCGRCEEVCPMRIPLPDMMRHWRERAYDAGGLGLFARTALKSWAFFAQRPRLYRLFARPVMAVMARLGGKRGRISWLPVGRGWTAHRDLPAPSGGTFQAQWWAHQRRQHKRAARAGAQKRKAAQ